MKAKKLISMLLVIAVMLSVLSVGIVSASATQATPDEPHDNHRSYYDIYAAEFGGDSDHGRPYEELAYHYESSDRDEPAWMLVSAVFNGKPMAPMYFIIKCPDRFFYIGSQCTPFKSMYGVYDFKDKKWMDVTEALNSRVYAGLEEACSRNRIGTVYGDADSDYELTILDATRIQRHLAGLDKVGAFSGDYDNDGEISILDATAIQRYLVGLSSNDDIGKPV